MAMREYLDVEIAEKEIITCDLKIIDVLQYREKSIVTGLIQEVPTKINATRFQTSSAYVTGSLKVFLNGLKVAIADVTEISSQIFEIVDTTIANDIIEVEYLESD